MGGTAIFMMILSMLLIWGGLILSIVNAVKSPSK